jgi:hypothetical protein
MHAFDDGRKSPMPHLQGAPLQYDNIRMLLLLSGLLAFAGAAVCVVEIRLHKLGCPGDVADAVLCVLGVVMGFYQGVLAPVATALVECCDAAARRTASCGRIVYECLLVPIGRCCVRVWTASSYCAASVRSHVLTPLWGVVVSAGELVSRCVGSVYAAAASCATGAAAWSSELATSINASLRAEAACI